MKVFDLHSDIFNDIAFRRESGEERVFDRLHYPQLKKGGVRAIICVVWVEPKYQGKGRLHRFNEILSHAMDDMKESKHIQLCKSANDMTDSATKINVFLGIEGMGFLKEALSSLDEVSIREYIKKLDQTGFRTGILVWNEINKFASGTGASTNSKSRGLTKTGEIVIDEMIKRNWLIDVSHLDETTFWDIYHYSNLPIFASHSNVYNLCDHERNLKDKQITAIAERGGIIGLNAIPKFIKADEANVSDFVNHIEYVIDLAGIDHVAFGFDFINYLSPHDLGTTFPQLTKSLESVCEVPSVIEELKVRGYSNDDVKKIAFSNAYNFIKNNLRANMKNTGSLKYQMR